MGAAILAFIGPKLLSAAKSLIPYAIALALLGGLWGAHKVEVLAQHHAGYVEGRTEVQAKWDADKAERDQQTAALAKAWDAERAAADDASRKLTEANDARFNALADQARHLSAATAHVRIPGDAVRVFNDAVVAANTPGPPAVAPSPAAGHATGAAGAAAGPDQAVAGTAGTDGPSTSLDMLTEWGVGAAKLYRTCRDRVDALVRYYDGLRAAQSQQEKPQ